MTTPLQALAEEASTCTGCGLAAGRTTVVFGSGSPTADLMFVGEAPGAREDEQGVPFVGRSGQLLDRLLAEELGRDADWEAAQVEAYRAIATGYLLADA